jgi:hypothetical protein
MRGPRTAKHQRKRVNTTLDLAYLRVLTDCLTAQGLGVAGCFLGELYAAGEAEFGVDVGEVGLHGAR